jgi:hypothetical protein
MAGALERGTRVRRAAPGASPGAAELRLKRSCRCRSRAWITAVPSACPGTAGLRDRPLLSMTLWRSSGRNSSREPDGLSRRSVSVLLLSREEARLHIHVQSSDGEAKFWIEPEIELARNYELSAQDLSRVLQLVVDHEQEIRDAWRRHFAS